MQIFDKFWVIYAFLCLNLFWLKLHLFACMEASSVVWPKTYRLTITFEMCISHWWSKEVRVGVVGDWVGIRLIPYQVDPNWVISILLPGKSTSSSFSLLLLLLLPCKARSVSKHNAELLPHYSDVTAILSLPQYSIFSCGLLIMLPSSPLPPSPSSSSYSCRTIDF